MQRDEAHAFEHTLVHALDNRIFDLVVGHVPPRFGEATVESLAVHAVMAGCQPDYFPVLLAAVEALLDPNFGLHGLIATTHVSTPLLIVNGPITRKLNINSGYNLFGQGWRANATIGRATRLILNNLGGAVPGGTGIPFYRTRLLVRPGLTGWAQVKHPYGDSVHGALEKLEYDLYYVKHRSLFFDLWILVLTVGTVVALRGQ